MHLKFNIKFNPRCVAGLLLVLFSTSVISCATNTKKPSPDPDPIDTSQIRGKQILLADPTIFYDEGTYYLYGTHAVKEGFEVYLSTDLKHWKKAANLALSKKDVYGDHGFWAPQVFKYNNKYYMTYTANEHIAIAESNSPIGPFTQEEKKPFSTSGKAIDPFVFIDDDGTKYLYFVKLQNGNRIFAAELKADFSDIQPGTVTSCLNAVDHPQQWENLADKTWTVTEGPTVLKQAGTYYLFYSANGFRSVYYALGYATANNPFGPWTKYAGNPILDKDMIGENGPGHGDFFRDEDGTYHYVFHTHFSDQKINPRKTALIKGEFKPGKNEPEKMELDKQSFYYLKYSE